MTPYKSILAAISLTIVFAGSGAAQQASPRAQTTLPNEPCPGCFAYLEFAPSLEPEPYAVRGQTTETSASVPYASAPRDLFREQARLLTSKQ